MCSFQDVYYYELLRGALPFHLRVLEPPMHHTWLFAGSHTFSHPKLSYLPMRATTVKALHYHPGLLLQMVWGLVATSYQGDPLNVGGSSTINISSARRRARSQADPLKSVLNLCTSFMTSVQITTLTCFSNFADFDVMMRIMDDLSKYKFNGGNGTPLFMHTVSFSGFCDRHDVPQMTLPMVYSLSCSKGMQSKGVTHCPQPLYTLLSHVQIIMSWFSSSQS